MYAKGERWPTYEVPCIVVVVVVVVVVVLVAVQDTVDKGTVADAG